MLIYTSVIGVILHPLRRCIKGVLGVLKVYFAPRQKVLNRCKLKVYY